MLETRAQHSIGARLETDPVIAQSVDAIVRRVEELSGEITGVRGPSGDSKLEYDELLRRAGEVKGRGLYYPYLGSGLGRGALVELADGSVKWDMISGIGVQFFGHSHPELVRASVASSMQDVAKHGNLQSGFDAYRFGETLVRLAGRSSRLAHAFVTTSGAMANESAIKVCYQKHFPAGRVLAFRNCFMGRSVTMAQIGDSAAGREGIPLSTQVDYMPFWNDTAAEKVGGATAFIDHACWRLEQYIERYPKMHACFIFELVQGEGGFNTAPREFFVALMDVCRAHGIAIWDDEIQSFGRTQEMFAYESLNLGEYVDVFCVGKMTQACATMFTPEYNPKAGLLSGTFTGSGQDFAVGTRVLELLRDGAYYGSGGSIARHHRRFREGVAALASSHPAWFPPAPFTKELSGGMGGMMRLTPFGGDKAKILAACRACYDEGVILFYCGHGPYHLRMLPPLGVMQESDWAGVFRCLERGLAKAAG
jgi:4-aminobutyrate aminotransferase-like enzyme